MEEESVNVEMPAADEETRVRVRPSWSSQLGVICNLAIFAWIMTNSYDGYLWFCGILTRFWNWLNNLRNAILDWAATNFAKLYGWCAGHGTNFSDWFTWRELANFGPAFFSTLFALISMRYPGENEKVLWHRGVVLWCLTAFHFCSFVLKVSMDYNDDHACLFHYKARTASGRKVLYSKSVLHLVGFVVFYLSVTSSLYNCLFKLNPWISYGMSIATGVLSLIYAAIQGYKSDKKHALVETIGEQIRRGTMLKGCSDIPPLGRLVLHEIDREAEGFQIAATAHARTS